MDIVDKAEISIEQSLQRSIDAVVKQPHEEQSISDDGDVLCTECWIVIPPMRLEAVPHATRCIHCQDLNERFR